MPVCPGCQTIRVRVRPRGSSRGDDARALHEERANLCTSHVALYRRGLPGRNHLRSVNTVMSVAVFSASFNASTGALQIDVARALRLLRFLES